MGYREIRRRLETLNARRASRRMRRVLIGISAFICLIYFASAVVDLHAWRGGGRLFGFGACIMALTADWQAVFWTWFIRRAASSTSRDERAQMDFGKPYSELSARHQFDVRVRVGREVRKGGRPADERDAMMQREAERRAFRVLRVGVPVVVLAYWVMCWWLPVGPVRVGLLISAVVVSGMAIPVMILPDLIRLWTEPDEVREMQVVERAAGAEGGV